MNPCDIEAPLETQARQRRSRSTRAVPHPSLFLFALACVAVGSPAAAQEASADATQLRFAWPLEAEARVSYRQVIEREGEGSEPTRLELEGEYVMHVHEHPSGFLVEHLAPLAIRFGSSPPLTPDDPRRLVYSTMGILVPHYVVTEEGELLGVEGLPELAAAILAVLEPLEQRPSETESLMAELLDAARLTGQARERWNALVGVWLDAELQVGVAGATESEQTNPLVPSVVLPYLNQFELVGMEPCGAPQESCARLAMVSFPNPIELTRVINEALQNMGMGHLAFDRLVQQDVVSLLTDPGTLLPHELTMSKLVEGALRESGQVRRFRRFDLTRLVYSY